MSFHRAKGAGDGGIERETCLWRASAPEGLPLPGKPYTKPEPPPRPQPRATPSRLSPAKCQWTWLQGLESSCNHGVDWETLYLSIPKGKSQLTILCWRRELTCGYPEKQLPLSPLQPSSLPLAWLPSSKNTSVTVCVNKINESNPHRSVDVNMLLKEGATPQCCSLLCAAMINSVLKATWGWGKAAFG